MNRIANNLLYWILIAPLIPRLIYGAEEDVIDDLSLYDLLNAKVTVASKAEENISDAPGVITVITQDELLRFSSTTLADMLKKGASCLGTKDRRNDSLQSGQDNLWRI